MAIAERTGAPDGNAGSVDKALAILESLSEHGGMSLRSLAGALRLHESTA